MQSSILSMQQHACEIAICSYYVSICCFTGWRENWEWVKLEWERKNKNSPCVPMVKPSNYTLALARTADCRSLYIYIYIYLYLSLLSLSVIFRWGRKDGSGWVLVRVVIKLPWSESTNYLVDLINLLSWDVKFSNSLTNWCLEPQIATMQHEIEQKIKELCHIIYHFLLIFSIMQSRS